MYMKNKISYVIILYYKYTNSILRLSTSRPINTCKINNCIQFCFFRTIYHTLHSVTWMRTLGLAFWVFWSDDTVNVIVYILCRLLETVIVTRYILWLDSRKVSYKDLDFCAKATVNIPKIGLILDLKIGLSKF